MTLFEYLENHKDDEVTVLDKDYDTECYFYSTEADADDWDKAMMTIAKKLEVTEEISECTVCCNISDVIENNLANLTELFNNADVDDIMEDWDNIIAGNVSEKWIVKFADALVN